MEQTSPLRVLQLVASHHIRSDLYGKAYAPQHCKNLVRDVVTLRCAEAAGGDRLSFEREVAQALCLLPINE